MKKFVLFLLFISFGIQLSAEVYKEGTKSITVKLGDIIDLDPVTDLSNINQQNLSQQQILNVYATYYSFSTGGSQAFQLTETEHPSYYLADIYGHYKWGFYKTYKLEAIKEGSYVFKVQINHAQNDPTKGYISIIKYNIKVVEVQSITFPTNALTLNEGESYKMIPTIYPDVSDAGLTWASSNNSIVTVSNDGTIKGIKAGTATITATTYNNKQAKCTVTVQPTAVTEITLNKTSLSLYVGDSYTLTATVKPSNASNKNVTWSSSNTAVAIVSSSGVVKGIKAGTATITCKSTSNTSVTKTCAVTVKNIDVTSIALNKTTLTLNVGDSETLTATVSPNNATIKTVNWSTSNSAVATVSAYGLVKGIKAGTATITCKSTSNPSVTKTCAITVKNIDVTSITLSKTTLTLNVGDSETLIATIVPSNATNKNVTWSTSNSTVASVSTSGVVKAISQGTATITCKSASNTSIKQICTVTVKSRPDAVTLEAKSYSRVYGEANPTFGYDVTEGTITSGTPAITCSATKTSPVGTYDIVISKGSVSNSTVNLVKGTLTITKAPLTISAGNYTKQEGEANPTFTPTFSGFKNSETKSVLTTQPTITTTATTSSPAGKYLVTISGAAAQNYAIGYINGTLTVTAKPEKEIIQFASDVMKRHCVQRWDTDGDGELSTAEAAAVKDFGRDRYTIGLTFNEFKYFTGLTTIPDSTFYNWSGMTSIIIPKNVTSIGKAVFMFCSGLISIDIPNSVKSIGDYSFSYCPKLESLTIPNSVTTIGNNAFSGCNCLTSITIPNSVTSIGEFAFEYCRALSSITMSNSITTISKRAFWECSNLTSVTIPSSVTTIESGAFRRCYGLTSVYIPSSVTKIGSEVFWECSNLTSVYVKRKTPTQIDYYTFGNRANATLYVPKGCKAAYQAAEYWKEFKEIKEIDSEPQPDAVTLTAKSYNRVYGEANPTFGYDVSEGTITSGTPTITCSATQTSPVGTYDIIISKGSVSNGTVNLVKGTLTITKAPLTISAGNYTKQEGEANPTFTPTFSGFRNNETKSVLTTQPTITTTATTSSPAGTYPVTVSGAAAQNYDISYVNGTLTVTAKPVDNANTFEPDYFWPDMSENVDKIEFIVIGFPKELGHFSADKLKLLDNEGTQVRTLQARWLDDGEYVEGAPFYKADKDIYQFVKFVFSSENTAAVKATGIYQFTVPEGYVWNDKYNDSDDDKGISAGARYNPEFTITYHVIEDVPVVKENIEFADAKVKEICIANWDRNNDGELSKEEAAKVTSLEKKFNYNKEITSFDELQYFTGLSSIGRDFYGCKNLLSVTLPTSLTSISTAAFSSCESLRKIHIPEKVNSIGFNPFSGCTNLEEMTVATNNPYFDSRNGCNAIIKKDNNELISGCKTSVIPEGIVNINYGAFLYISTLTSINIPASVKCISYADGWHGDDGTNPFIYCSGLTSITVADGNPVYDSRDNCNAVIETSTNTLRVGCKATMIPNSVKIIGSMAFEGSGVTRVDIPNSIEEVKSAAFMDCKSLTEVTLSSSINTIWHHAFGGCTNLQKVTSNIFDPFELDYLTFSPKVPVLYVPKGRKAAYEAAGWAQYFSKIIEMDEDGIDEMDNGQWTMDNVVIYNLSGQRLSKPQRGVNIINGKKVLIK